ncbi:MAG: L,D-transpeptidase [Deltaproteobacteria bacterium]|nr:L,D-transpeptidase [Deltaproteobacteria bacterium]
MNFLFTLLQKLAMHLTWIYAGTSAYCPQKMVVHEKPDLKSPVTGSIFPGSYLPVEKILSGKCGSGKQFVKIPGGFLCLRISNIKNILPIQFPVVSVPENQPLHFKPKVVLEKKCPGFNGKQNVKLNKPKYFYLKGTRFFFDNRFSKIESKWYFLNSQGLLIPRDCVQNDTVSTFRGSFIKSGIPVDFSFAYTYNTNGVPVWLKSGEYSGKKLEHHKIVHVNTRKFYTKNNHRYLLTSDNVYINEKHLRIIIFSKPPSYVKNSRWIEVNKSQQTLVAYQGSNPVFMTLVSTGINGRETPTGIFRIFYKRAFQDISRKNGNTYTNRFESVPWVQYFDGENAIHPGYWHSVYGSRHSIGCVETSPFDARFLFHWTHPYIPNGFYKITQNSSSRGSLIRIVDYQGQNVPFKGKVFRN